MNSDLKYRLVNFQSDASMVEHRENIGRDRMNHLERNGATIGLVSLMSHA